MIIKITSQNQMTSLFDDHPGKQWARGLQKIPSHRCLENKLQQLEWLLLQHNIYILSVGSSILSQRRIMNHSLCHWQPGRYSIKHLNNWIHLLISILSRWRIQMKPVRNSLHGTLQICGDVSTLLTTWQAASSTQDTMPRQFFHVFQRWSCHMLGLLLSIMQYLWILLPQMQ